MDTGNKFIIVNGIEVKIAGERNLLELIRKAGIDIPTFCYHSELSIYGACRLCLVDIENRGVVASCSTPPEPGLVIRTDTKEIREMRKINIELLLANHKRECPSCVRSSSCALQDIARRLGVDEIRFKQRTVMQEIDKSSPSIERDPNKCVLCGDCVRVCKEVQGIGAIDFAFRGANACVVPAFKRDLNDVECVNCGQCAAVCPTGALIPRQHQDKVWNAIYDPEKIVIAQIAPAVRVALGEYFGFKPGENVAGKLVRALKMMGFKYVYDTCFSADMTIWEEATEFINRLEKQNALPMYTSCCPAWVKYAEIYFPELLNNLSTCRSPQQMFGAVARKVLPEQLGVKPENITVVSIMPCSAKKYEAQLPKFSHEGKADVDYVLTTVEIGRMINSMGIKFEQLESEAFDMPFGFATGAGVIFGASGGVMEAALRYVSEKLDGKTTAKLNFKAVRGNANRREAAVTIAGKEVRVAIVHGLENARKLIMEQKTDKCKFDFIEVMACPGGCIAGAGQPITHSKKVREQRISGIYDADNNMQLQKSQDNYMVEQCYNKHLGGCCGSDVAHHTLHTGYSDRSDILTT